ncbi:MAG: NlpC/P60 family protein [Flavobacteriaceae bacterium]
MKNQLYPLLGIILVFLGCSKKVVQEENPLLGDIEEVRQLMAPDKRVAHFQVEAKKKGEHYVLTGESNLPEAVEVLKSNLAEKGFSVIDSITVLPEAPLNGLVQGLVNISVANLRSHPKHSAELATQATLGTPLRILKHQGDWYWVQTPDGYLAWVDHGGIIPVLGQEMDAWLQAPKIIFTTTYGHAFANETGGGSIVSDLVAGAILRLVNETDAHYQVGFPDGRMAFVKKEEGQPFNQWLDSLPYSREHLVNTAKTLVGAPYLWGGTSTKGVDCSGFTKTIYFMNGMIIPRDASQQVHTGISIDSIRNFENLQQGDLLFFGRKATDSTNEKVVHVGMWIGNDEFIHSSGRVKIGSVNPDAENYDPYNLDRYLRTKRLLGQPNTGYINLQEESVFKD